MCRKPVVIRLEKRVKMTSWKAWIGVLESGVQSMGRWSVGV